MSEFNLEEFRKYNYKGARASIRFSTVLTGFFTEREKLSSGRIGIPIPDWSLSPMWA